MTRHNVLVFPCGTEIGLEIYRSIEFSIHFEVFGASSSSDHGEYVYRNYIGGLPYVDEPQFIEMINRVVKEHDIEFIIPAHDSAVLKLVQASASGELACAVIGSPLETCETARSKTKTYERLQNVIAVPTVYASIEEAASDFPVFLKPDVGQGSKGTYLAKTREEVEFYTQRDPSLLIMEYLPGPEYTIDCFTDKNGTLLFAEGRQRNRISNGISVNSTTVVDDRFKELALKINEALSFRGAWFFQVKENADSTFVLMEIAPRIAGTMGLVRCKGTNLVLLSIFDALEYDVAIAENAYQLTIDRALENRYKHNITYNHVYIDFDDLIIFNDKVNTRVIAFIYQCINNKVKIHLITKHKESLDKNLARFRLSDIFDEIIWIQDGREKYVDIKEPDAIFIDDSFAERKAIQERHGIPTFDSHMIEGLMEKF